MTNFIAQGIEKGIISFDQEQKNITYHLKEPKKRRYTDPEEKVQALIFCRLVLQYGYPAKRITINESVTMGSSKKEADIIVYNDDDLTKPYIVVECKKQETSEAEFREAVKQAFSYANALAGTTKYVWVTKGDKDEHYKFDKETNKKEEEADIPYFGSDATPNFRFVKGKTYKPKTTGNTWQEAKPTYGFQPYEIIFDELQTIDESSLIRIFK